MPVLHVQGWTNSVHHTSLLRDDSIHSWRAGLRKMGSMNVVNDCKNQPKEDDKFDKPAPNHFTHVIDHVSLVTQPDKCFSFPTEGRAVWDICLTIYMSHQRMVYLKLGKILICQP